ncbi:MAG: ADP-ribosylglycohydrolase family protein [Myxococcota bacterium]
MDDAAQFASPTGSSPLVVGALGDAYGFGFEFADPSFVESHNDLSFHPHPLHPVTPGAYSDDTQMQLALAEWMLEKGELAPEPIANWFVRAFKRDMRKGYSKGFYALLCEVDDGAALLERIDPSSERNGAAMRAPILGWLPRADDVARAAEVQAKITHDTKGGVDSAIAAALLCHYFAKGLGPKEGLATYLDERVPGYEWSVPWSEPVPVHGIKTVRAAVTAIGGASSLSDLLRACVAFTGDVDSVATIALAGASGSTELARDVPSSLWTEMENGTYGRDYLVGVEKRLKVAIQ